MSNRNSLTPNTLRNSLTHKQLPQPRTTNWDAFGVYNQRATMRVTAQRLRKHGAPVAIVFSKSGELRYTARTADQRNAARVVKQSLRDMNGLNEALTQRVKPVIVEQKPVKVAKLKFTITKVAKPFRTGESGNKRVTMWKVESKGIRKYFVSRKAAQHFVKAAKAVA